MVERHRDEETHSISTESTQTLGERAQPSRTVKPPQVAVAAAPAVCEAAAAARRGAPGAAGRSQSGGGAASGMRVPIEAKET